MINTQDFVASAEGDRGILDSGKNPLIINMMRTIATYNSLPDDPKVGDLSRKGVLLDAILHYAGYYLTSKPPQDTVNGKHKSRARLAAIANIAEQMGSECNRLGLTQLSGWSNLDSVLVSDKAGKSKYYWLEMLDPMHRHGADLSPLWFKWLNDDDARAKKQSFWDHIGTKMSPALHEIEVKYFPEKITNYQDKLYCVYLSGGLLKDYQGNNVSTRENTTVFNGRGWAIFVCSASLKLYLGSHIAGEQHHSSFLGGGAVAGAGEMVVENGRVRLISCKSGHYKPSGTLMRSFVSRFSDIPGDAVVLPDFDKDSNWYLCSELRKAGGGKPMTDTQLKPFVKGPYPRFADVPDSLGRFLKASATEVTKPATSVKSAYVNK